MELNEFLLKKDEEAKILEIREKIQDLDLKLPSFSDNDLITILRGAEYNINKAVETIEHYIIIRLENSIDLNINPTILDIFPNLITKYGVNKKGSPTYSFKIKYFDCLNVSFRQKISFIFAVMDSFVETINNENKRISIIWDRKDFDKEKHFDEELKEFLEPKRQIFVNYFIEKLDEMYILHINWVFRSLFTVAKIFLKESYREKIKLLSDEKSLLEFYNLEDLEPYYKEIINNN